MNCGPEMQGDIDPPFCKWRRAFDPPAGSSLDRSLHPLYTLMTWSEMTSLTGSFVKSAAWEEGGKKRGEGE